MFRSTALAILFVFGFAASAGAQSAAQLPGTYDYNGTETDGSPYESKGTVVVKSVPSGAFEASWDNGAYLGVGQVIGNTLAIASVAEGKNSVLLLDIATDGNLSGKWWRRTDAGGKGTEVWTKKK